MKRLEKDWRLISNFISKAEERLLVSELQPILDRQEWSRGHFDQVIQDYREMAISRYDQYPVLHGIVSAKIEPIFKALGKSMLPVHVLELDIQGKIAKHIDNIEASGEIIAGLSLKADCNVRFEHTKYPSYAWETIIPQRSLYIQRGDLRYEYSHEIFPVSSPRISILFRDKLQ